LHTAFGVGKVVCVEAVAGDVNVVADFPAVGGTKKIRASKLTLCGATKPD
jgi:hypothetical protein